MSSSDPATSRTTTVSLPDQIPTAAAITAARHILSHGHDGIDPVEHFKGALADALGLTDPELQAAEQAVMDAITAHPRDQGKIARAMGQLDQVTAAAVARRNLASPADPSKPGG